MCDNYPKDFREMIEITKDDSPLEAARKLIEGQYEEDVLTFHFTYNIFDIGELEEIAAHLMAYCKRQREVEDGE